ncbi:nucleotidyl transferase AbiEii/AbiGii toxin family protein [Pseudoxanthomonas putridarboris]|uniref:Nucleotidyl transferase AbiEii/AbiGii toxin family protein n=1 Tax=Pseudoxanthomonas putridarboris TaxID=752605 RepID=A0ABU9J579_9GAMM
MMQQSHLTAWQTYAPWPRRSQLEQDLRLSRGVAAIFVDPVLSEHLAMRGGTVLHKAHLAPAVRYSEDIDLVLVKAMDTITLDRHLRRVLTPVLGQPTDSLIADAWLAIRNVLQPSRILRTAYRFVPLGLRREETIKVEVNLNESASLYPLVSVELDTLDDDGDAVRASARSYDINEMLGTKTRALMQREQGRDLYDLFMPGGSAKPAARPTAWMAPRPWKPSPGIWSKKARTWAPGKRTRCWMRACARRPSAGTWTRCCGLICRRSMWTKALRSCERRTSGI